MSLGTKIILLFAFFLALNSLFNYGVRRAVNEPTYRETEKKMMLRELEWFRNILIAESQEVKLICQNLSDNNKIHNYLSQPVDNSPEYMFDDELFTSLGLNIFVILNSSNEVVYSRITADDYKTPARVEGFSASSWAQGHPLLGLSETNNTKKGILKVKDSVAIAASNLISAGTETPFTVVVGRVLGGSYLKKLTSIQGLNAIVTSVPEAGFREGEKIISGYFYSEKALDGTNTALLAINDIASRPSLAIKAIMPSTVGAKSRNANRIGLVADFIFTLILLMLGLFLVYQIMGKRLERLIDHIIGIRHSGVLVKIVQESNGDEIDLISYEFNQMVTRLQRDIELRTQVEIELKRSLAELERFADVASHDLQEPLRSVASCLQLLELQYKENIDDQGKQLIDYAVQGSRRMKNLIKALLAYSNIGNTGIEIATCNCNKIAQDAIGELKKDIDDSKAEIICDELPVIQADRFRLQLLFSNIIHNAIKYAVPGKPPVINISCEKIDKSWRFAITDNGIGIEKEYYTQIFVAFKRLHAQDKYEGSGIGLAICRRIIEQHKGRIWVKSEQGNGSTFYFSIPI